jgi:hypothetical protein
MTGAWWDRDGKRGKDRVGDGLVGWFYFLSHHASFFFCVFFFLFSGFCFECLGLVVGLFFCQNPV